MLQLHFSTSLTFEIDTSTYSMWKLLCVKAESILTTTLEIQSDPTGHGLTWRMLGNTEYPWNEKYALTS